MRRGPATILHNINWQVQPGEHWVLLGANGSGKTSLLNCLAAYLIPSEGTISVCGKTFGSYNWQELRKQLGIVSNSLIQKVKGEELGLDLVASGRNAVINTWESPSREDQVAALELLRRAGVASLAERRWEVLSQGERQRLLICRALMADPALLILDEPCSGLDPVARVSFLHFVDQLATSPDGPSIILVTHHVEEITPAFTHALVIKDGSVLKSGQLTEVMNTETLSEAFNATVHLHQENTGWTLTVPPASTFH